MTKLWTRHCYSIIKLKNVKMFPGFSLSASIFQETSLNFPGFPWFFLTFPIFSLIFQVFPKYREPCINRNISKISEICSKYLVFTLMKSHFPLPVEIQQKKASLMSCMCSKSTIKTLERRNWWQCINYSGLIVSHLVAPSRTFQPIDFLFHSSLFGKYKYGSFKNGF